ncbi:hypothetical protein DICPUDRAFT_37011 [Dictyostelium purpureum]|uniref:Uncharacterized protein n=1 Tax=Dictyostelium purpureum TaxID=5786 RepID=F0ZS22_DICPU|nr:uncharacterized protein DICPUDRAFT_37011 [Dictyostelium purpureum]EGC33262.1 hypothetical protein DICPUDRAFT_37011 [Dictyostelium purpureum]|eukprot:XP_003290209.1 hypothetical protein DICPUDRAFT_37011 [Dictyostelium purpureum]
MEEENQVVVEENNRLGKDFKSAIIIGVPEDLNDQIQEFRKKYDKSFVRW